MYFTANGTAYSKAVFTNNLMSVRSQEKQTRLRAPDLRKALLMNCSSWKQITTLLNATVVATCKYVFSDLNAYFYCDKMSAYLLEQYMKC